MSVYKLKTNYLFSLPQWAGALIKDGKHLYEAEKAKRESFGKLFSKYFLFCEIRIVVEYDFCLCI